jgi:hypothetical protein
MTNKKFNGFRGGGGDEQATPPAPAPYDPTTDRGYIEATKLLASLKPQTEAAGKKMTTEQIIASLPALQQALLAAQRIQAPAAPGADWGAINNLQATPPVNSVNPVYAPVYQGGLFNNTGVQTPAQNYVQQAGLLGQPNGGK